MIEAQKNDKISKLSGGLLYQPAAHSASAMLSVGSVVAWRMEQNSIAHVMS